MLRIQRLLIVQTHHHLNRLRLLLAMLLLLTLMSGISYGVTRLLG